MALETHVRRSALQRLGGATRIDFHVLLTLLLRGWTIIAGVITMALLPMWLSPVQQGYYYTFASLLILQVFFELGLSQVIMLLVSREVAHLTFGADGTLQGDAARLNRLGGLIFLLRRWYGIAAILFAAIGGTCGWIFFGRHGQALPASEWAPVWCVVVALNAINLYLSPQLAVIEGTGRIGHVARVRLIQSIIGYGGLWTLLVMGSHLWAIVAVPFTSAIATIIWLHTAATWLKRLPVSTTGINWRRDIFPLQWRIAASWASGYFLFNLFTPIVFAYQGPHEAGRLGMAMSVFNAVTTLGLSWINAKAPMFTMHIARGEPHALNILFNAVALRSTTVTAALAAIVVATVALAIHLGLPAAQRIAAPNVLLWIACASVINTFVYASATYMRAHGEEPMLPVSLTCAAATIPLLVLMRNDVSQMMMGYAAICAFMSLPWTLALFRRYRARHRTLAPLSSQVAS